MNRPSSGADCFRWVRRLRAARRGAAMVEYAMLLPVFLLLTLGTVEIILILFDYHRLGEATRRAARQAIIEAPIAQLSSMPASGVLCQGSATGVTCSTPLSTTGGATFLKIVQALQEFAPPGAVDETNVTVRYQDSGITDPVAMQGVITPLVTVELTGVEHQLFILNSLDGLPMVGGFLSSGTFQFPPFTTSKIHASGKW